MQHMTWRFRMYKFGAHHKLCWLINGWKEQIEENMKVHDEARHQLQLGSIFQIISYKFDFNSNQSLPCQFTDRPFHHGLN